MPLRTSRTRRAAIRLGVVALIASALVAAPGSASADTPVSWPDAEPMSTLEALLVFVGIPAGLFALIALLVMAPSLARGPRYRPGVTWLAHSEQFGARPQLPAPTGTDAADSQEGEAFTVDQRRSIDRAIAYAEKASELAYSVYVGAAHGRARAHAEHLHRDLPDPASSVLVLVDPATREVEIVAGTQARARVDEQSAGLAILAMQSAFGAGDLAGGIVAGLQLLGDHARRPASLHTDSP